MATITITIPDALIAAYNNAAVRRLARLPAQPLPVANRATLQSFIHQYIKGHVRAELFALAAAGENIDAELDALELL